MDRGIIKEKKVLKITKGRYLRNKERRGGCGGVEMEWQNFSYRKKSPAEDSFKNVLFAFIQVAGLEGHR